MQKLFGKKTAWFFSFVLLFSSISFTNSACSPKTGCPINEEAHVKPDKKGNLPTRGGRSELFPKDMRKKVSKKKS